jgi:cyclopropane-fatty-acyl-phospholipid synthase
MGALGTLIRPLRSQDEPAAIVRRVHDVLARHGVSVPTRLWTGEELGPSPAPYRLILHHPWSLRALLVPFSDRVAGEAYIRDVIDVEGSLIAALHDMAALRRPGALGLLHRAALVRDLLSLERPPGEQPTGARALTGGVHSKERDAAAVRIHYDVGNDFYRTFLDEQMVYSCGYFAGEDPAEPAADPSALDRAQLRKLDLVCRKLRLREGERFLDVGCGWGALVLHAARHYGVRAVGITLSNEQAELARERVAAEGLTDRVDIRLEDYRDVRGTFDAVASVGMFEHVGKNRFETYFASMRARTAPGGRFMNHAITTGRRMRISDLSDDPGGFVGTYVFPDAVLAPAHVAVRLMEHAGFELIDVQQLRPHYARTLRHWVHNLETNRARARLVCGEVTYRTWRAYMAGSVVGFESGDLGVVQVLGARGAHLPLGRAWMQPLRPEQPSPGAGVRAT